MDGWPFGEMRKHGPMPQERQSFVAEQREQRDECLRQFSHKNF